MPIDGRNLLLTKIKSGRKKIEIFVRTVNEVIQKKRQINMSNTEAMLINASIGLEV